METKKLTKSAILSAMLIILSIIFVGTGIGGQFYLDFMVPIVIAIICLICGMKWALLAGINTILVIILGLGRVTAGVWMIQSVMLGLVIGYLLMRQGQVMDDILLAAVAGCMIMLFIDYFLNILTGVSILDPVDLWGLTGNKALEEVIYYLGIASLPIGTMLIVYVCSLILVKRLGLLNSITKCKYKVIQNFFKYKPYMYCSRKFIISGIIYVVVISIVPMSDIAYIKAFCISLKYILIYFIFMDSLGIISQWCYMKTRSPLITNGIGIMILIALFHSFKWSLYILMGIGILMDYQMKIREKQIKGLNALVQN